MARIRCLVFMILMSAGVALAQANSSIKIGYVGGITGFCKEDSQTARIGMEIAREHINAAGGVLGKEVQIVWRDSSSDPAQAAEQARALIANVGVDMLTGPCSEAAAAEVGHIAREFGVALFTPIGGDHLGALNKDSWMFQTGPSGEMEGRSLALYASQKGWRNIGILSDYSSWSQGVASDFAEELARHVEESELVLDVAVGRNSADLSNNVSMLSRSQRDALLMLVPRPDIVRMMEGMARMEVTDIAVVANRRSFQGLSGGQWRNGNFHAWSKAAFSALDRGAAQEFAEAFGRIGGNVEPDAISILGYDTIQIIASAIEQAGSTDPEALRSILREAKFSTLRGELWTDGNDSVLTSPTFIGKLGWDDEEARQVMTKVSIFVAPPGGPVQNTSCPPHCNDEDDD